MVRLPLMSGLPWVLLLACSACAPAGEHTVPVAPAAKPEAKPETLPAQAGPTQRG